MAWRWWDKREGFPHIFASPIGKWRRPTSSECGENKAPAKPLLVLGSAGWRWDSGDKLRSTVAAQTNPCWPGWDGSEGGNGILSFLDQKLNRVPGLASGVILVQRVKPNPFSVTQAVTQSWQPGCAASGTSKLVISAGQAWEKPRRGAGRAQQASLALPFAPGPLCMASAKPELSPINGDGRVLSALQQPHAQSGPAGVQRVSPHV